MPNPYYISMPDYRENSEGVRAIHYLCHALNMAGYEAFSSGAVKFNPDLQTPVLNSDICRRHEREGKVAIGVYTDISKGNRLDTPVCVRYMLNKEGVITGQEINAGKDDLFFYYIREFAPEDGSNYDCLAPVNFDLDLFKPDDTTTQKNPLLYLNRIAEEDVDLSGLPNNIEILSNKRPLTLKALARKLQETPVLYTYEFSGTCTLAILCGCPVVVLYHPNPEYEKYLFCTVILPQIPGNTLVNTQSSIEVARKGCQRFRENFQSLGEAFHKNIFTTLLNGGEIDLTSPDSNDFALFKPDHQIKRENPLLYLNRIAENEVDFAQLPDNIEVISSKNPLTPDALSKKLQAASALYVYETSFICELAICCGCPVVTLHHPDPRHEACMRSKQLLLATPGYTIINTPTAIEAARKECPKVSASYQKWDERFQAQLAVFIEKTQTASQCANMGNHLPSRALSKMMEYYRMRGPECFLENNFEQAEFCLRSAIQEKTDPVSCLHLAIISAVKENTEDAEIFIRKALELSPGSTHFLAILGNAFLQTNQRTHAIHYLREAIETAPKMFALYPLLARALFASGQEEEAIHLLKTVADIPSESRNEIQDLLTTWSNSLGIN